MESHPSRPSSVTFKLHVMAPVYCQLVLFLYPLGEVLCWGALQESGLPLSHYSHSLFCPWGFKKRYLAGHRIVSLLSLFFFFFEEAADEKEAKSDMNCLWESVAAVQGGEMRQRDDNLSRDSNVSKQQEIMIICTSTSNKTGAQKTEDEFSGKMTALGGLLPLFTLRRSLILVGCATNACFFYLRNKNVILISIEYMVVYVCIYI